MRKKIEIWIFNTHHKQFNLNGSQTQILYIKIKFAEEIIKIVDIIIKRF